MHDASDIDLLILGSDPDVRPTALLRRIPADVIPGNLILTCYTIHQLTRVFATGSPFGKHLDLEAAVIYDPAGALETLLREGSADAEIDLQKELLTRLAKLRIYYDLDKFVGNFLFVLSHLYSIAKSIVMLALVVEGVPEFKKSAAFASFAERHPQTASDVGQARR